MNYSTTFYLIIQIDCIELYCFKLNHPHTELIFWFYSKRIFIFLSTSNVFTHTNGKADENLRFISKIEGRNQFHYLTNVILIKLFLVQKVFSIFDYEKVIFF